MTNCKQYVPTEQSHFTANKCITMLITYFGMIVRRVAYFIIIKDVRKVLEEWG